MMQHHKISQNTQDHVFTQINVQANYPYTRIHHRSMLFNSCHHQMTCNRGSGRHRPRTCCGEWRKNAKTSQNQAIIKYDFKKTIPFVGPCGYPWVTYPMVYRLHHVAICCNNLHANIFHVPLITCNT